MARRNDLSSTSARIFSRKPSRSARIFSALLLGLSLLVTLAGLGTAIYLERTRDSSAAPTPLLTADTPSAAAAAAPTLSAAMVATSDTHDPPPRPAAAPPPPPPPAAAAPDGP